MVIHWLRNLYLKTAVRSRRIQQTKRRSSKPRSHAPACIEMLEPRQMLTMSLPTNVDPGATLTDVQIADVNGDGLKDVVGLNSGASSVSVMLQNADGTYQTAVNSAAGGTGTKFAVSDFNHDGKLDIMTVEGYNVDLLKGNGDGSFQAPIAYYASAYPNDIGVGDVNNDGFDDVFTASFSYGGTTQLFINDGHGGFLPSRNLAIGPTGLQVEGADVNGDGNLDLVQTSGNGYISVLMGHGDGTFISAATQNIGMTTQDLKLADFNGDGKIDLAAVNGNQISIFDGTGANTFLAPTTYNVSGASRIQTGDINGDGHQDVIANNGMVLLGRGTGGFYAPTNYGTASGNPIAIGDLNGDGSLDIVSGVATAGGGMNITLNANNDVQLLAGATQISVTTSGSAAAGTPFSVTVTALDADGNVVTGFLGTVSVLGAPGTKPVSYTFTAADNGVHTITNAATLFTAGQGTYTVTSPFLPDASGTIQVTSGAIGKFVLSAQTSSTAGTDSTVTVTAYDAYGNLASAYVGTVTFSSSDVQAGLPANYTFTADDAGTHTFTVNLKTAGYQSVSVVDTLTPTSRSISNLTTVTAAEAASLSVSGGGGFVGSVNAVTIVARDAYGNIATSYNGIVHLSASDPGSTTSADAALVNGIGTFTVTPTKMGAQTLTANDVATGAIIGSETINVTPGWGARFVVDPMPSKTVAGQTQTAHVTVYDAYGNVSTVYTGLVAVTGSDGRSVSYVYFTPADAGVKDIPVTLYTSGVQSVTFRDYNNPGVTFTQTGITVSSAAVASISVTPLHSTVAGVTQNFTVSARDIYGNIATDYVGTVTFASSDTQATLPATYTFTAADAGTHTFQITYKSAGGQDITVADTTTVVAPQYYLPASMTYYQRDIMITPGQFSTFTTKSSSASNTTAGAAFTVTVSAADAYGNAVTSYTGTAIITSTDAQASLPASHTFTAAEGGTFTFTTALKTAGSQTITFTDSANSANTASLTSAVKAAAASKLAISTAASVTAGTAQNVTVTVTDAYGNVVTNYTGTVQLSSSDLQAVLPASYKFTNKDAGVHTFSVTLKTAGTQSLTAADTLTAGLSSTASGIVVTPSVAAVASFSVTGYPATTAGTAKTFIVTAKDAQGNVITGYTGTVTFSSSDVKAGLPASYTFTAADNGTHTFTATLKTAGTQSITVKDAASATALGTQSGIVVSAGVATQIVISAPTTVVASASFNITVTAYDAYGNIATGYRGKVTLSSTDSKAGSTSYSFSANDAGVHVFSFKFGTLGAQTLTVTDNTTPSLTAKFLFNVVAK